MFNFKQKWIKKSPEPLSLELRTKKAPNTLCKLFHSLDKYDKKLADFN